MKGRPRILILMHYLEIGGAEKALMGLLSALDPEKVDVDLFLHQHTGAYMNQIPSHVRLLPEINEYAAIESSIFHAFKIAPLIALKRIFAKISFKRYLRKGGSENCASHFYMDYLIKSLPSLTKFGEYDLAVSFLDPPHVVQDKVLAKRMVEWIHTDFNAIKYDKTLTFDRWSRNDAIISISKDITVSFAKVFPSLSNKIVEIENIIDRESIFSCCDSFPEEYGEGFKGTVLLTMGRLNTPQKNILSIPTIASILKSKGISFRWYIMGAGDSESINAQIRRKSVDDVVKLLGAKNNPYPYIKNCDIYVQPSLYEGKSIAVREAQIIGKPVIITNYPSSGSQVISGEDGIICGMSNEEIADAIISLIEDTEKRNHIISFLGSHDYCLRGEVDKFYDLINEYEYET